MRVLSIGFDRKIFEEGSAVRARMVEYAALFDELHIIVFSKRSELTTYNLQLTTNSWIYPTNSFSKWLYVFDAVHLSRLILSRSLKLEAKNWVVDSQDPFECGLAAWRVAKKFKFPLHVQIHADFLSPYFYKLSFLNRIRVLLAKNILPRARAIRVVSERIKKSLTTYNLQLTTEPNVLPVFSDMKRLAEKPPSFSLKDKYPGWDFIILTVARLSPEKNIGFALELLSELVKKYPKTGMVVVGEGIQLSSLRLKAKSLKLEASVVFEGWQSDLVSHYKTADLFLQTSLFEGFGLSLLEAAASGSPAVSSDVGVAPELLTFGGKSFVCPVNDRECFLRKISELIEHRESRTAFGEELTRLAVDKFSKTKKQYLAAYAESFRIAAAERF